MAGSSALMQKLKLLVADAATWPLPATSLTEAALRDDVAAIRAFLDGGAEIDERTIGFVSPLAAAAGRGALAAVDFLIERGASLEPPNALFPLLAFAIMNRRLDVVDRVLAAGAPVAPYRPYVMEMAKKKSWDVVEALIHGGADRDWLSTEQQQALAAFVEREQPRSTAYREKLSAIQARENAQSLNGRGRDPLSDDARAQIEAAAVATVEQEPALARTRSEDGTSILALAVESGSLSLVEALLRAGAEVDPSGGSATPLGRAVRRADAAIATCLLRAGANANACNGAADHPLILAARSGSLACIEALINAGARLKAAEKRRAIGQLRGPDCKRIAELIDTLGPPGRNKRGAAATSSPAA